MDVNGYDPSGMHWITHPSSERSGVSTVTTGAHMAMTDINGMSVRGRIRSNDAQIPTKNPYKIPKMTTLATVCTPIIPKRRTLQQNVEMMTKVGTRRYPTSTVELSWPKKLAVFMITS